MAAPVWYVLMPDEAFAVVEKIRGLDGILFLRLRDGRGWIFDHLPGVGTMCVRKERGGEPAPKRQCGDGDISSPSKEPRKEQPKEQQTQQEPESEPAPKRQRVDEGASSPSKEPCSDPLKEAPAPSLGLTPEPGMRFEDCIPRLDPWGCDKGRLVEALNLFGVAFLEIQQESDETPWLPQPYFGRWHSLWQEATTRKCTFWQRNAISRRFVSFNRSEDLGRTMEATKAHTPDLRYNFGVTWANALHRAPEEWGDLCWIAQNFRDTLWSAVQLIRQELLPIMSAGATDSEALDWKVANDRERWGTSRLRHSVYPNKGACTEHTDYGVVTFQQSTGAGLEAQFLGEWIPIRTPTNCAVVFAGDMLELLTNGKIGALRHRVSLEEEEVPLGDEAPGIVRQSHILFVQPDKHTVVKPLQAYRRDDGTDMQPVRYGDWHHQKTGRAFSQ